MTTITLSIIEHPSGKEVEIRDLTDNGLDILKEEVLQLSNEVTHEEMRREGILEEEE